MSGSPSTISIVLATSNGEAFLETQLASLASQTRSPLELIVSDDASTDATPDILREFQHRAPFPVILDRSDPAKGRRENLLSATRAARGRWLSFCDQDDVWHARKLEVCSTYMGIPGITQVVHQADLIDRNERDIGHFDQGIQCTGVKRQLAYGLWGAFRGFSMLVDRRILQFVDFDRRFVDGIDARDLVTHHRWAFFLAQTLGHTVEIAERLAKSRQHGRDRLLGGNGPKARPGSIAEVRKENALHLAAALRRRDIVAGLPVGLERKFPLFDRDHALATCDREIGQLCRQEGSHDRHPTKAILERLAMMLRGDHRMARGRSVRWRSFAKDPRNSLRGF